MRCQRCGREISPLRQLTDREFCSESCRRKGPRASAWVLRDSEYTDDPFWEAAPGQTPKPQPKASGAAMAALMVGLVGALVVARILFPDHSGAVGGTSPVAGVAPMTSPEGAGGAVSPARGESKLARWLDNYLPGKRPIEARLDFVQQLGEWTGSAKGWIVKEGVAKPGALRLWKPTLEARDYQLDFEAVIERRGVSWVYRAKDPDAYYATRIRLNQPGAPSGASIIRYVALGRETYSRTELPLPIVLERNRSYRITTVAMGSRFTTIINGKVVDEWQDKRLVAGGVGFFADDGEQSELHWASFRERKGLLERFISANLLLAPGLIE